MLNMKELQVLERFFEVMETLAADRNVIMQDVERLRVANEELSQTNSSLREKREEYDNLDSTVSTKMEELRVLEEEARQAAHALHAEAQERMVAVVGHENRFNVQVTEQNRGLAARESQLAQLEEDLIRREEVIQTIRDQLSVAH